MVRSLLSVARTRHLAAGILLFGFSLFAQTNPPQAKEKAPQTAPPSAIESVERDAVAPFEVLTDTMGVDFNPYLARVLQKLHGNSPNGLSIAVPALLVWLTGLHLVGLGVVTMK